MPNRKRFPRFVLFLTLILALCAGTFSPRAESVEAMPLFAGITISNVPNDASPTVGSNIVFTISLNNTELINGGTNVSVMALLPSGLTYISDDGGGAYNNLTGIWTIGNLAAKGTSVLRITVQVTTNALVDFVAIVSSVEFPDISATATITPNGGISDLVLTQTVLKSPTITGQLAFSITVTNNGPFDANNVVVKNVLSPDLVYFSDNSSGAFNKDTGLWVAGDISNLKSKTLTINAKVKSTGTFTNTAEVWSVLQLDPTSTPGNSSPLEDDYAFVTVNSADLSLTQTSSIGGINAIFTIKVTNNGPNTATNVLVSNSKLHTPSYNYVSHSASPGTSYTNGTGIWNIGSLASGATVTLIVTTTWNTLDENRAQVSSVTEVDIDSIPGNSSGVEDDEATTPSADLSLIQSITNPAPYVNPEIDSNVTFRITVFNAGNANATSVKVKSILPTGLTYVSHTSGQTYDKNTGIWSVGSLARNTSIYLDIVAKMAVYGNRTNWAEISFADQSDPDSKPGDSSTNEDDDDSISILSQRAVIINEIAWAGTTSSAEDEWLELYNPSDTNIDISGWTIRKNSCAGPVYITLDSNKTISRDGYFLLERGDNFADNSTVSEQANQIYLTTVPALLNEGETLYLCDKADNSVDTANKEGFGNPTNPWPAGEASSPLGSMERQGNSAEKDSVWVTNRGGTRNGSNSAGGIIYGTPGRKNSTGNGIVPTSVPARTQVPSPTPVWIASTAIIDPRPIINEILARPGFDWNQDGATDVFDEFIEIKNLTVIDISLSGWRLDKFTSSDQPIVSFSLPTVTLKPGERIVFYSKETNLLLSDGGETVRLVNSSGKIYDAYTYNIARLEDKSFCRLPDGNPGNSWFEDCIPTPIFSNTREGQSPTSPDDAASPFCNLPDTIPLEFFIPECNGYGADIWNPFYWDFTNWIDKLWIQQTAEKWRTFIE